MTKIPERQNGVQALVDAWHEAHQEPPRPHMGASLLGHSCDRWLWLSFRWAVVERFTGRKLRLFRRGHLEEATVIADLRAVGLDVRAPSERQARVDFGSHVSGSLDGIIESGVPEAPKSRHLLEVKTHNKKIFDALEKDGVEKAKPMHYVQMQVYMHGLRVNRALYVAVCKDDDRLHTERVHYDAAAAERAIERGKRIALADRIPPKLSADPSWYECKWCPAYAFCHQGQPTQQVNCRTCAHATAKSDSTWRCERHDADNIPVDFQRAGCESHVLHPDLVPWPIVADECTAQEAVYLIDGVHVRNGEADAYVFGSAELVANPEACAKLQNDPNFLELRTSMGGRVSG